MTYTADNDLLESYLARQQDSESAPNIIKHTLSL